jgi:thiol:disulfide interchange protein DsbD
MRFLVLLFFVSIGFCSVAQILSPAKWTYSVSNPTPKVGEEIELIFHATIDKNWYLYASEFPCEDPIKMSVQFKPSNSFQLVGKLRDINPIDKHDKIFDCDVRIFVGTGEFRQKIKILTSQVTIQGESESQVCSDVDGKCIPSGDEFSFESIHVQGGASSSTELFKPDDNLNMIPSSQDPSSNDQQSTTGPTLDKSILDGAPTLDQESFFGYLIFAFILGLASLITPCVFPMVPMTVTFFLKDNQTKREGIRKAVIFGLSIVVIYTLAGTLFAVLLGAE